MQRMSLLGGCLFVLAILVQVAPADAGCYCSGCYRGCCRLADPCRGSAIRSPLESPDPCDCPVGGKYVVRPYYPGYMWDQCVPPSYFRTSYGVTGPGFGAGGMGYRPRAYGQANFGGYTGANQDETHLLHLGGFGPGAGSTQPGRSGDIINRLEGR